DRSRSQGRVQLDPPLTVSLRIDPTTTCLWHYATAVERAIDPPGHLFMAAWAGGLRVRRSLIMLSAASRAPPAMTMSHGVGEAERGAVPPKPAAAPPVGMTRLPTASWMLLMRRPPGLSSTTRV